MDQWGSDSFKVQLSTAGNPTKELAIDVKHHHKCWMTHAEHSLSRGPNSSAYLTKAPEIQVKQQMTILLYTELEFILHLLKFLSSNDHHQLWLSSFYTEKPGEHT